MVVLDGAAGAQYLQLLKGLLTVARPGALLPDLGRLHGWLELFARPTPKGKRVRLLVDAVSGLPARKTLERFHTLQKIARAVLAGGARPSREARAFSAALVHAELPPLGQVSARLVARARGAERYTVTYDSLDPRTGCPTRFTAQLEQRGARHLTLAHGDQAQVSASFGRELALACDGKVEDALVALQSMEGLFVPEVVRGQLGPLVTQAAFGEGSAARPRLPAEVRALREVVPPGDAVLSVLVDRAGITVPQDRNTDPWRVLDASPEMLRRRAAIGYRVSLERRLVCTPAAEPGVRRLVRGVIVRSG